MVYTDIEQIFKDGQRIVEGFINDDLSNLDLGSIPPPMWENAYFYNTNFSGTNIKFYPRRLKNKNGYYHDKYTISGCDFSNCELLPWSIEDLENVEIKD